MTTKRQSNLEQEIQFNLEMIQSFKKRLRNVYNDFNTDEEIDAVCDAINFNLTSLYDDCRLLKGLLPNLMNDELHKRYTELVPTLNSVSDPNALYQL
jgi:hypothetical protein